MDSLPGLNGLKHQKALPVLNGLNSKACATDLKVVHAVGQCDHEARVIVDGLVTEDDVHSMV